MLHREFPQRRERLVPALLRFMREDRRGSYHPAGGVDDGDLDTGTEARIEAHRHARAGRRRQQQIAQIRRKHAHGFRFGQSPQPHAQINVEMHLNFGTPRPPRGLCQPAVAGAALIGNGETLHNLQLIRAGDAGDRLLGVRVNLQLEDLFLLAAKHRQDAV